MRHALAASGSIHSRGRETLSLRGDTGVVKAVERSGDRVMVSVEKRVTSSSGDRRETKRQIGMATADRAISTRTDGDA